MSDWDGYAAPLGAKLNYTNTFYHQEPKLDIAAPELDSSLYGALDFIISSEVFEHIVPPVTTGFINLRKLLKPTGVVIFTVPYGKQAATVEHFPELHEFRIVQQGEQYHLENRTKKGVLQAFDDLRFHGGPGATLEMRIFSESSLTQEFYKAGFGRVQIYSEPVSQFGICWKHDWSLPIAARPG